MEDSPPIPGLARYLRTSFHFITNTRKHKHKHKQTELVK